MKNILYDINSLTVEYSGQTILNIPEMKIYKGIITAIIGPSGAGKSTLLRILNALETPTAGNITYEDGCSLSTALHRKKMVMAFQKAALFNDTVFENIAMGLKFRRMDEREIQSRTLEMLDLVGLSDKKNQMARTLSGGEAQRVSLARAMAVKPDVLLLDEPTANLDPANVAICEELIRAARGKYDISIILVTHNMFQARRLSDKTALMINGQIIEYGVTSKFFINPEQMQSISFLNGEMVY